MTMQREPLSTIDEPRYGRITLRDVTAVLFRQRRLLTVVFRGHPTACDRIVRCFVAFVSSGDEDTGSARTHGSGGDLAVEQSATDDAGGDYGIGIEL